MEGRRATGERKKSDNGSQDVNEMFDIRNCIIKGSRIHVEVERVDVSVL